MAYFRIIVFRVAESFYSLGMKHLTLFYGPRTVETAVFLNMKRCT